MDALFLAASVLDDPLSPEEQRLKALLPEPLELSRLRARQAALVATATRLWAPPPHLKLVPLVATPIPGAPRPPAREYSPGQQSLLQMAFESNPQPTTAERNALARVVGRTPRQVQVYFQNARQRRKAKLLDARMA